MRRQNKSTLLTQLDESFDCSESTCPTLQIENDPPASIQGRELGFFGYADPSIKKDPDSNTIWLVYSWPNAHFLPDQKRKIVPGVDLHLARSEDNGKSWDFEKKLWTSSEVLAPDDDEPGFIDREVLDIESLNLDGSKMWISAHMEYFVPKAEGRSGKRIPSFIIQLSQSSQITQLPNNPVLRFGAASTQEIWDIDLRLTDFDPELEKCSMWNEPALIHIDGRVYLGLRCLALGKVVGKPNMAESDYAFFSVPEAEFANAQSWQYEGLLQTHEAAKALGGESLTQMDIAVSAGKILAFVTPDDWSTDLKDFIHYGCRVLELESVSPPRFKYSENDQLLVHHEILASDQGELGSAACAYEPLSETGILMTKREITDTYLKASIHQTELMP